MFEEQSDPELRIAIVRTSDRQAFKRCRRKWNWHSPLRENLTISDSPSYFWIGTGGHFAMEDYHGYNHYGHPAEAFRAYVDACRTYQSKHKHGLPDDWEEQTTLAEGILEHYIIWAQHRDTLQTVWLDGEPQVEITIHIPLPIDPPPGFDKVVYQFTLDRLVEIDDEYWVLDWKFYKAFSQGSLELDQQMSAYIWGAKAYYDKPIAGAILHEFRKELPNAPKILASGKLSLAENQKTTHRLYREAIIEIYGDIEKAPSSYINRLNDFNARESEDRDDFIRRSRTRRTELQTQAQGSLILLEAKDMCNPDLPLYPNPTRDCSWDCSLQDVCLMVDRDDDWSDLLNDLTIQRVEENKGWRQYLQK